jgi:hypothetical protein
MKGALRAGGMALPLKTFGMTIHAWTMQGAYLHAVMRGETRRNLESIRIPGVSGDGLPERR